MMTFIVQELKIILNLAKHGSTTDFYYLYHPASLSYAEAPKKIPRQRSEGTKTPLHSSHTSPFIGQSVADAAQCLQSKPARMDLDPRIFAVLDNAARSDGEPSTHSKPMVVLCRTKDKKEREIVVRCVPVPAKQAGLGLAKMKGGRFEQLIDGLREHIEDLGT